MSWLRDNIGYAKHRVTVDLCFLYLSSKSGGVTRHQDFYEMLFDLGIGEAKYKGLLELAYSTTGAISRAATYRLLGIKMLTLHKTLTGRRVRVKTSRGAVEDDPGLWSYRITDKGRIELQRLIERTQDMDLLARLEHLAETETKEAIAA